MILLLLLGAAVFADPTQALKIQDFSGFHWSIAGPAQGSFPASARSYGRDLNWVIANKEKIAEQHRLGKKVICYFNLGRLQADPRQGGAEEAYRGVYRHYRRIDVASTCLEQGDRWGEPWINWRGAANREKALIAYEALIQEAKDHCDGLEYDNTDVYENIPRERCGSKEDVKSMLRQVCDATHKAGMSCVLKNSFAIASELEYFDGAIGEQCFTYPENALAFARVFGAKKPVACVEYRHTDVEGTGAYRGNFRRDCAAAKGHGFASFVVEAKQSETGNPVASCEFGAPPAPGADADPVQAPAY